MKLLRDNKTYRVLLLLNSIVAIVIYYTSSKIEFPDASSYWHMAESFNHGTFSSWYFLPVETPETLRLWGYPFFLYLCQLIYKSPETVKLLQLFFYFGTIALSLKLISRFSNDQLHKNIFLLLLLPNIQLPYYSGQVATESLTIFLLVCLFYSWYCLPDGWRKSIILSFITIGLFQLRPSFLLFPLALLAGMLLYQRKDLKYGLGLVFIFGLALLPFGFWNKKHQGIFKVTPLEGGSGAAHLGFWSFRMPDGYNPKFYWDASFSDDMTQPAFVSKKDKEQYKKEYEAEWMRIRRELDNYLTPEDSVRLMIYKEGKYKLFEVMSSDYTIAREKLLKEQLVANIRSSPGYYLKTRVYTFFRIWFTGINRTEFQSASLTGKLRLLAPFVITFLFIFCGLWLIVFCVFRKVISMREYWPFLLLFLYVSLVHLPFGIQARYTVPAHIFVLLLLALLAGNHLHKKMTKHYSAS